MFINISDVDLDATIMKAKIKYENKQLKQKHIPKSSCINALCQYVCVCMHECAYSQQCLCDLSGIITIIAV